MRHGHFAGTPGAIITFYCNAEPGMRDAAAVNAFRTAFDKDTRHRLHQFGVKSAGSRDHEGMGADGGYDALTCRVFGCAKAAIAQCDVADGNGPGRHRAAIDLPGLMRQIDIADGAHGPGDLLLHRMFRLYIVLRINAQLTGQRQHTCVLAGTIVVDLFASVTFAHQCMMGFQIAWPMRAAFIKRLVIGRLLQHVAGNTNMLRLAVVGGAGKCDLFIREAEAVSRARQDHRQELERLAGRARMDGGCDSAFGSNDTASLVHDAIGAAMTALDSITTGDFGDDGISHALAPCAVRRPDTTGEQQFALPGKGRSPSYIHPGCSLKR